MRVSLSDLPVNKVQSQSLIDLQHHMNEQHDNATLRKWTVAKVCSKRMKVPSGLINIDILQGRAKSSKNDRG